ncbi:BTB/POZ and MATH domain-containing protein 2-like [Panicum virgatum]|uniref:Uncharacterized protein n=1 Tax=Panicum virgatum TaxID=38727 RepID=A0A8T0PNC6_PANVG|nr:BTB/POZ and MATH domain-containing protein 2-like [Panicum virgatum]KAG2563463.1 hypothetical protein PVAP13_8KG351200 [Panicum virgatum]
MSSSPACAAGDGGGSGSASTTVAATGWQVLKVEGYSQLKGIGVARRIKSTPFMVGGHSWCVTFFPDGSSKETADWVCFGLRLERRRRHDGGGGGGDIPVLARAKYSFLDQVGEPVPSSTVSGSVCAFSRPGESWGRLELIRRKDMESRHVRNNRFWVRCDVTVVETTCRRVPATVPPSDLRRHLGDLLAGGVGADVTFEVGGETVAAHLAVLAARSPVFRAEFFGAPLKENAAATPTTRVRIHGVEPRVFRAMLHFVYTDALPEIGGDAGERMAMAQHLLVAADRYGVERLRSVCEFDLCMYAGEDVAVSTLVLAEQHGCHELKEECFKILESSGKCRELLVGDDLEHLASSSPSLLGELSASLGLDELLVGNVGRSQQNS